MLKQSLYRPPAFSSLHPSPLVFDEVSFFIKLRSALSFFGPGRLLKRKGSKDGTIGYYLFQAKNGYEIFLKVVPRADVARALKSDEFSRWVAERGLRTCQMLPEFPINFEDSLSVLGYEYFSHRFADLKSIDISAVGHSIAELHVALAEYPDQIKVKNEASLEMSTLKAHLDFVHNSTNLGIPCLNDVVTICEENKLELLELFGCLPAQVLHGDLVLGNILFPYQGPDKPIFIDFEDTQLSWGPIELDICLALERFVIVPSKNQAQAVELGRLILSNYGSAINLKRFLNIPVEKCLKFLAVRALIRLLNITSGGAIPYSSEWEKFIYLYRQASDQADTLTLIQDGFLAD